MPKPNSQERDTEKQGLHCLIFPFRKASSTPAVQTQDIKKVLNIVHYKEKKILDFDPTH